MVSYVDTEVSVRIFFTARVSIFSVDSTLAALRSVGLFPPPPASDPKVCNFISFRNNFNKIMNEPSWKMLVERVGRVIFLRQMQHPMCNFGLVGRQFEECCVAASARHTDSPQPPPLEFCTTVHACLGAHRLFLGAEIDMVDASSREYVEVKTTKPKASLSSSASSASTDSSSGDASASAATKHVTADAAHDVLSESEQQRIWVQCFLAGVDRLVVGVDQCPERGVLDVPDAACVLELGGASREGGALRRVTHVWKERRLKHARRVLDWVVESIFQNALEENAVYWLEQRVAEPIASSSSAFASSSSSSASASSSAASASSTLLSNQQDDTSFTLSLSRIDARHAFVTDDVRDMF